MAALVPPSDMTTGGHPQTEDSDPPDLINHSQLERALQNTSTSRLRDRWKQQRAEREQQDQQKRLLTETEQSLTEQQAQSKDLNLKLHIAKATQKQQQEEARFKAIENQLLQAQRAAQEAVLRRDEVELKANESENKQQELERAIQDAVQQLQEVELKVKEAQRKKLEQEEKVEEAERRQRNAEIRAESVEARANEAERMCEEEESRASKARRQREQEDAKTSEAAERRKKEEEALEQVIAQRKQEELKLKETKERLQSHNLLKGDTTVRERNLAVAVSSVTSVDSQNNTTRDNDRHPVSRNNAGKADATVQLEIKIRDSILEAAASYFESELYSKPLEYISSCSGTPNFRKIESEIRRATKDNLLQVCSSQDALVGSELLDKRLKDAEEIVKHKVDTLLSVLKDLEGVARSVVQQYNEMIEEELRNYPVAEHPDRFRDTDIVVRVAALSMFETAIRNACTRADVPATILEAQRRELDSKLNAAFNEKQKSLLQQVAKIRQEQERKNLEKVRQEIEARCKREADEPRAKRQSIEEREKARAKAAEDNWVDRMREDERIAKALQQEENNRGSELPMELAESESSCDEDFNILHFPTHTPTLEPAPLPTAELAIHMGITSTRVGYVWPTTADFVPVADVENCLYYKANRFVVAYDHHEARALGAPAVDFKHCILQDPTDKSHTVRLPDRLYFSRLEEILGRFFLILRRRAEIQLKMTFPNCVIVVPQCLNDAQRCCVTNGATIAGFGSVELLNDTTAMAFSYSITAGKKATNIVAVTNTYEGPLDIASFTWKDGVLECHSLTGHYFHRDLMIDRIKRYYHHAVKKYFECNELRVSPSSPNTTYVVEGDGELIRQCIQAVNKITLYRAGAIHHVNTFEAVKGAAYLCCLRSRDPCTAVMLQWKDKLPASKQHNEAAVLEELERKVFSQDLRVKLLRRDKNPCRGGVLTPGDVQRKRDDIQNGYHSELHQNRLHLLKVVKAVELHLPNLTAPLVRQEVETQLSRIHRILMKDDLTKGEITKITADLYELHKKAMCSCAARG